MSLLVVLPGIGAPIASTIMHFIFPEIYPIYDFRTVEVLYCFCYLKRKMVSPSRYPDFQDTINRIRRELVHYNLRQIDRALFAYHKICLRKILKNMSNDDSCFISEKVKSKAIEIKMDASIPEFIKSICENLGAGGKIIRRKDIIDRAKEYCLNPSSILPADYCDNTRTGRWSKHSFLHSISPGRYVLQRFKNRKKDDNF